MEAKVSSLLVSALLVAGVVNAVEVYSKDSNKLDLYDKVDGLHYFPDNKGVDGDQTYMHLGFKDKTQVTDQLIGYGQWGYQVQGNSTKDEDNSQTCVTFAGLKLQDVSPFNYDRNYGTAYDVTSQTDVLSESGGDTYGSDNPIQQRGSGSATYRNTDFFGLVDGLNFAVQYQGKNGNPSGEGFTSGVTNNGHDILRQNGDGVGGFIIHDYEGLGTGSAVSSSKRTSAQNIAACTGNGDRAETYTGGLKYSANNIYLAAQYIQIYNVIRVGPLGWANKMQNFETAVQYQFDFGLCLPLVYPQFKGENLGCDYDDEDVLKYVDVGTTYYFNKNISIYVDYRINLLDDNQFTHDADINTDNIVAPGLAYQF